jgi:hypothetical protein
MPASRNSLDQRAISSPADLNFPQLLLQQGAECSGSSGFSFISDCCPSLSPRREKSGLADNFVTESLVKKPVVLREKVFVIGRFHGSHRHR